MLLSLYCNHTCTNAKSYVFLHSEPYDVSPCAATCSSWYAIESHFTVQKKKKKKSIKRNEKRVGNYANHYCDMYAGAGVGIS
jgi:hypothetical protein